MSIDTSGLTQGDTIQNQKKIIPNIISGTNLEKLINSIVALDRDVKINRRNI